MHLKRYLKLHNIPHSEFASVLEVHETSIDRLCSGRSLPNRQRMLDIAAATGFRVMPNDFYPEVVEAARSWREGRRS